MLEVSEKQTEECGFNRGSWILVLSTVLVLPYTLSVNRPHVHLDAVH